MNKGLPFEARAAVLVVDDELVRILTVQALEEAGFRVEEAGNSDEALSRLDGHPIVALVTDIDMPGSLDGCGLARRVSAVPIGRHTHHFRSGNTPLR
jgi:CheY-like chemotaxis protein